MKFRIAAMICLSAWTTNAGVCQDQQESRASETQQTMSEAAKNHSANGESAGLGDTLFEGEWKLNSANLIFDGIQVDFEDARYPKPKSGWIKDGTLNTDGESGEYEVVTVGESEATIRPVSNARLADPIEINRTTYLLFLTVPLRQREASKPSRPHVKGQLDVALPAEPPQPEAMVLEFWRVDPNRSTVVERMELLSNLITELEISGDATELDKAWQELQEITAVLKRMDTAPEIASLRNKILLARKAGDHILADQWEKSLRQDYAETIEETKIGSSDSTNQQSPSGQNANTSPTSPRPLKPRALLERIRDQLVIQYDEAEQRARNIAAAQRGNDSEDSIISDEIYENNQRLTQAIRTAFNLQQQLQDVRLRLAGLDLQELKAKHERRAAMADQVIEKRMQQLLKNDIEHP